MVLFFSCIVYVLQKRLLLLLVRYKQMLLSLNKMAILFTYVFCLSLSQRHLYFVNLIVLFLFVFIVFFSLIQSQLHFLVWVFFFITILIVAFVHCSCFTVYLNFMQCQVTCLFGSGSCLSRLAERRSLNPIFSISVCMLFMPEWVQH